MNCLPRMLSHPKNELLVSLADSRRREERFSPQHTLGAGFNYKLRVAQETSIMPFPGWNNEPVAVMKLNDTSEQYAPKNKGVSIDVRAYEYWPRRFCKIFLYTKHETL
ncbi:hypothetical protein O181_111425 [Austropuccinia psidii MF-1]|uniref:Uncharacterized protein n=1 Tax=Austropuccinia psidii MF-1 TaxID=1389203 RepID=A0A9Q3JYC9_9BASI|nr:hypothetical protein [Austropuccinia psidii MF-1]